jgi:hypothetical protein
MPPKTPGNWSRIGTVKLRREYLVERSADVYRVSSATPRKAEFGQLIDGSVVRHLAKALSGQTVWVEDVDKALRKSGLKLPYQYGFKLHFFAQSALVTLVASGQASHRHVGARIEYDIA